jgi:hypothetical protein
MKQADAPGFVRDRSKMILGLILLLLLSTNQKSRPVAPRRADRP